MLADVEDAGDGWLRGGGVAGHEVAGESGTLCIIDTGGLFTSHHPPLRLFAVDRLELQHVAD